MKYIHFFITLFIQMVIYIVFESFSKENINIQKEILCQNSLKNNVDLRMDSIKNSVVVDTTNYIVRIDGKNNNVEINGKKNNETSDTLKTKNKVIVSGENNSIKINQTNQKSEVIILQKGGNNKISISHHH